MLLSNAENSRLVVRVEVDLSSSGSRSSGCHIFPVRKLYRHGGVHVEGHVTVAAVIVEDVAEVP